MGWNCFAPKTFTHDFTMPVPNGHNTNNPQFTARLLNMRPSNIGHNDMDGIVVNAMSANPGM
jgi:hypothetical protein